jgi:hypothetical protein
LNTDERTASGRFRRQVFLPKDSYRARRAVDAIKLWPVLGSICFVLPIIWTGTQKSNVSAMVYLFVVWGILIVGGAWLGHRAEADAHTEPGDGSGETP